MSASISRELLQVLACPKCKGPVELSEDAEALICHTCRLVYEIREGIPVMLIDEAIPVEQYGNQDSSR
ncbi:MAG: Trm112 family protein [Thermodesulfobacteria bacterium]|nr:Trm112 family protein [Thermodesulfobacteriota bacterium]